LPATTIILPISREQHLLKVFASLELLECDRQRTSLPAFVDGESDLFMTARNLVEQSKFAGGRSGAKSFWRRTFRLTALMGNTAESRCGPMSE
jgi:hypothetical protein